MKKIILLVLLISIAFSCNKKEGFTIDATIKGMADGRKVFLKKQVDRKVIVIDSTTVKDGKFSFNGKIKEPIMLGIFFDQLRAGIFPFIDVNDTVKITVYKDSIAKSVVKGSALNTELLKVQVAREEVNAEAQSHYAAFQEAQKKKDTATINKINSILKNLNTKAMGRDWEYIKSHPDSYVTPLVFNRIMTDKTFKDSIRIEFSRFSKRIQDSDLSKPIRTYFDFMDKQKAKVPTPKVDLKTGK